MKIRKKHLDKAVQALEDNEARENDCIFDRLGPQEISAWLWMALKQFSAEEEDHRVVFTAEGTISRSQDVSGLSPDEYQQPVIAHAFHADFDIKNIRITKMEVR